MLTGGGDLREAQVEVPLSVSHSSFDHIARLSNRHLKYNRGYAYANDLKVRLRALTDLAKD